MIRTIVVALVLALSFHEALPAQADTSAVANIQVVSLADGDYLLRLQSSGPQAFDVLPNSGPSTLVVRLYQARLGELPELPPPPFGAVTLVEDSVDTVLLRIDFTDAGYRATVAQGGNANSVEVDIQR
jgi:hypothetical protein